MYVNNNYYYIILLKPVLVFSFPSRIILIVLSSLPPDTPRVPMASTPGHRPHHCPKVIQLSPNFHLCMGVWIESLKPLNSSVSKLEETLNILRSILQKRKFTLGITKDTQLAIKLGFKSRTF